MSPIATPEKVTPRSIIRHRPISTEEPELTSVAQRQPDTAPVTPRASRPHAADVSEQVVEWQRGSTPKTARTSSVRATRTTTTPKTRSQTPRVRLVARKQARWQAHPFLYLGIGMLAMLVLWLLLSTVSQWVQTSLDDLHYGRPRTFQIDALVGHNEQQTGMPTHFIALNLRGHIEIIEIQGGDASHTRIYVGPQLYGPNADLVPVTLRFLDVNGDHQLDMIVTFQGTHVIFINDQGGFRPLLPAERDAAERVLQQHGG